MHVLHQAEQVEARVSDRLREARSGALTGGEANGISQDAIVRQLSLFVLEPVCGQREVWQEVHSKDGNSEGESALDDEQPFPASNAMDTIQGAEGGSGDKSGERSRQ